MTTNAITQKTATQQKEFERIFELQKKNQQKVANRTAKERIAKLKYMLKKIEEYKPQIKEALFNDFKKHPAEVDLTDILPVTTEIKYVCKELKHWMAPKSVSTPITMLGTSSHIHTEPKGVVLIISPWNFPFNLTFGPLITAVAAGNCVVLKPSEHTPHTSAVMAKMIRDIFPEEEVAIFEGDHIVASGLLKLPFNHIFFTGSPSIGKIVMRAAAENLSSVTLELGGKSPTIIDETADIKEAAGKIAWSKYMNNGQICIAPDYLFVHQSKKEDFLKHFKNAVQKFYGADEVQRKAEPSYCRMVNSRHYERVKNLVHDAVEKGATVELGNQFDDAQDYIAPTLLTDVSKDSAIMREEIFGPVLPMLTYDHIDEVINHVNADEKPLAFYIFSKKKKNINYIIKNTRAGGTCINDCVIHFFNHHLPFGGSNNSGIGKSHGHFGFQAFSNERSVLKQNTKLFALKLMQPPFNPRIQKLIDLTMKWF